MSDLPEPQIRRVKPTAVWMVHRPHATPIGNTIEVTAQDDEDFEHTLRRTVTVKSVGVREPHPLKLDKFQIPELIAALQAAYSWKDGDLTDD